MANVTALEAAPRPRLRAMLLRLDVEQAKLLDGLVRRTRVPKAVYLREAVALLLAKYSPAALDDERCPECGSIMFVGPDGKPEACAEHCGYVAPRSAP